jgi:serine/threonine-protein kinase
MHVKDDPPLISEMVPEIAPVLDQILKKVLSKEPSKRYRTADQLGRVLMNFGTVKPAQEPLIVGSETSGTTNANENAGPGSHEVDWASIGLGLAAMIAVLGLIPFWMWIYFLYNPPIR